MKKEDLDLDLDQVLRSDDKLAHLTAERVKAPKRRPPSSVFQKEAVSPFRNFLCVLHLHMMTQCEMTENLLSL